MECVNQQLSEARVGAAHSWVHASSGQSTVGDPSAAGRSSLSLLFMLSIPFGLERHGGCLPQAELQGRKLHKTASEQQARKERERHYFVHIKASETFDGKALATL